MTVEDQDQPQPTRKFASEKLVKLNEGTLIGNHNARRKQMRNVPKEIAPLARRISMHRQLLNNAATTWNDVNAHTTFATERVFQNSPRVYQYASQIREIPEILNQAAEAEVFTGFKLDPNLLEFLKGSNIFEEKIGKTSLIDIEQMPLPLQKSDIGRINKLFKSLPKVKDPKDDPVNKRQIIAGRIMIEMASQKLARPDLKITIPDNLKPVNDRLKAYFEYWTALTIDPPHGTDNADIEEFLYIKAIKKSAPWLMDGLASFVPACLGITPASVSKLYESRFLDCALSTSAISKFLMERDWKPKMLDYWEQSSKWAHRLHNLPPDLQEFQYLDKEMDEEASQILLVHYSSIEDVGEIKQSAASFKERIKTYREVIHSDIMQSNKRRLLLSAPDDNAISNITLTCQNKDVLIFILQFKNSNAHLTLELGKDGRVYGFPAQLIHDHPKLEDQVFADVLPPVLEEAQKRHPSIEPVTVFTPKKDLPPTESSIEPKVKPEYVPVAKIKEEKPPRRLGALTPIALYFSNVEKQTPSPRAAVEETYEKKQYRLNLAGKLEPTEEEIEEYVKDLANSFAKNDPRMLSDVRAMIETLVENPYGPGVSKLSSFREAVTIPGTSTQKKVPLWHYRADQRVELEHPESKRLRAVYAFPGKDIVLITKIMHHNEFEQEYS